MAAVPGFETLRKQQEAFMKTMMGGMPGWRRLGLGPGRDDEDSRGAASADDLAADQEATGRAAEEAVEALTPRRWGLWMAELRAA